MKTYIVQSNVKHARRVFSAGEGITLEDRDAAPLLLDGAIAVPGSGAQAEAALALTLRNDDRRAAAERGKERAAERVVSNAEREAQRAARAAEKAQAKAAADGKGADAQGGKPAGGLLGAFFKGAGE